MRHLINFLKEHPEVESVFFNEDGGYLFSKNGNHTEERHRDDVLAMEDDLEDEDEPTVTVHGAAEIVEENVRLKEYGAKLEEEIKRLNLLLIDYGYEPEEEDK